MPLGSMAVLPINEKVKINGQAHTMAQGIVLAVCIPESEFEIARAGIVDKVSDHEHKTALLLPQGLARWWLIFVHPGS